MSQIIGFIALVAVAFGMAQCSFDAMADYEHGRYLVEAERTNQMQVHENGLTERQVLSSALTSSTNKRFLPLNPTSAPVPTMPGNGTIVVVNLGQ